MSAPEILFVTPVATAKLAGFPASLSGVTEARRIVETARLPVVRSSHAWLDAANRLTLAEASCRPAHVEAARIALCRAVAAERRESRAAPSNRAWALAA